MAVIPSCIDVFLFFQFFQLARHNKELQAMLKPGGTYGEGDEALEFYAKHTAQIEVRCYVPVQEQLYGFGTVLLLS